MSRRGRYSLIAIAIGVVVLTAVIYYGFMRWWWPWPLPTLANGRLDEATYLNQELALGAVVTGFGTLVLAAFLGVFRHPRVR